MYIVGFYIGLFEVKEFVFSWFDVGHNATDSNHYKYIPGYNQPVLGAY